MFTMYEHRRVCQSPTKHVDKGSNLESCLGKFNETHEIQYVFIVTGYDTAHTHEPTEHPLDAVTIPLAQPASISWNASAIA